MTNWLINRKRRQVAAAQPSPPRVTNNARQRQATHLYDGPAR